MKYITHNDMNISTHGTHGCGRIHVSYDLLCTLFGQPWAGRVDYKSDAEWQVEFEDGTVACIYNWKNGMNFLGHRGTATPLITEWNVGAFDSRGVELIDELIENHDKVATVQGHNLDLMEEANDQAHN